ncbi:hypothetical protein AX16_005994 [Volvariella volvacea WC 439]|nr:hypothetical protein AX16_005994 [Volvariella volvacea WC 439]
MFKPKTRTSSSKSQKKPDSAVLIQPPYLFLGPRTSSSQSFIEAHAITHVLSVGTAPLSSLSNVTYLRLPLTDNPSSSLDRVIGQASDFIDSVKPRPTPVGSSEDPETLAEGSSSKPGMVLVHCVRGVARSPTIVTAYLMTRCGMRLSEALGAVVRARPAACPGPKLMRQLKELEESVYGERTLQGVEVLPSKVEKRVALFGGSDTTRDREERKKRKCWGG